MVYRFAGVSRQLRHWVFTTRLTSLCLIQIKVEVVFELLLLRPVNRLLLLAFLGQAFFFSTWFCQSIRLLTCNNEIEICKEIGNTFNMRVWCQRSLLNAIIIKTHGGEFERTIPLSEASGSSEGTGVPGCSVSWFSSGVVEAAASGDDGLAEDEEYGEDLLSNGLA